MRILYAQRNVPKLSGGHTVIKFHDYGRIVDTPPPAQKPFMIGIKATPSVTRNHLIYRARYYHQ